MSYSSAIYRPDDDGSLGAAQDAKYRRILDRLQARDGDRVLEIGCGWGGFAELAVSKTDRHTLAAHIAILCTQERHEPAQILGILCVVHLGHALLFFIIPAQSHTVCNVGFHIAK